MRPRKGKDPTDFEAHRFSWVYAEDVKDVILAVLSRGNKTFGEVLHVAHDEATNHREVTAIIAEALRNVTKGADLSDISPPEIDLEKEAGLPTTDFGALDISKAKALLGGWRPTPMREAVRRAVSWYLESDANRRYHIQIRQHEQRKKSRRKTRKKRASQDGEL